MHSSIIQLEAWPIDEWDLTTPDDYCDDHWFLYAVADYVAEDADHEGTLKWFRSLFESEGELVEFFERPEGTGVIFKEGFHEAYFGRQFVRFKAALVKLANMATEENFRSDELAYAISNLRDTYTDKYGIYIQNYDTSLVTLNKFLRHVKPDTPYYFGGTVDYHA